MKRFLTLALTFAMCLTLVSCSGTTTSESPASTGTASAAEADDTVYELKLAHIYAADHPFNVGLNQLHRKSAIKPTATSTSRYIQPHSWAPKPTKSTTFCPAPSISQFLASVR